MLHRVRAEMRFPNASGMAAWAQANMHVRWLQAVHIRQGEPNAEPAVNDVRVEQGRRRFVCDLALMDEAHAQDAFNALSDHNVLGASEALGTHPDGTPIRPWVELHVCDHGDDERDGCVVVERAEG